MQVKAALNIWNIWTLGPLFIFVIYSKPARLIDNKFYTKKLQTLKNVKKKHPLSLKYTFFPIYTQKFYSMTDFCAGLWYVWQIEGEYLDISNSIFFLIAYFGGKFEEKEFAVFLSSLSARQQEKQDWR